MKNRPLREVCGLSTSHPVFIGCKSATTRSPNDDNVDGLIGIALKEELARHVGWT